LTRNRAEEQLQEAVAEYLDLCGVLWCHPPNGGHRRVSTGAALKRQGVKRGVPDVLIFEPTIGGFGMAFSLMAKGGRVTKEQDQWLRDLIWRGWGAYVCRSFSEVQELCKAELRPKSGGIL
jgi:hypothetical protein